MGALQERMRKFTLIIKIEEQYEEIFAERSWLVQKEVFRVAGERCVPERGSAVRCGHIKASTDCRALALALASTFHVCVNNPTGTHARPCETGIRFRSNRCPFSMSICVPMYIWYTSRDHPNLSALSIEHDHPSNKTDFRPQLVTRTRTTCILKSVPFLETKIYCIPSTKNYHHDDGAFISILACFQF